MRIVNPLAKKGEDMATAYLKKKGYQIVERNFRRGYGEIDIIAVKDNTLVFIEVKTRTSNKFGSPLEAITPWKLASLTKTAQFYKVLHPHFPDSMRIDAIAIYINQQSGKEEIEHSKNILS